MEAAFAIPVLFLGTMLLLQPSILLYDRVVMSGAAAEGCRMLATSEANASGTCEDYIRRRLGAVPQQDNFHVHSSGCSWQITCTGAGGSEACVSIVNEVEPLPLIGAGAGLLGMVNDSGNFELKVEARIDEQPDWVAGSPAGTDCGSWVGAWLE